jgi:hypothetical protein
VFTTRTRRGSDNRPGGSGRPKLTSSRPRFSARPSSFTAISRKGGAFVNEDASTGRPAVRNINPVWINDLREKVDIMLVPRRARIHQLCAVTVMATHKRDCLKTQNLANVKRFHAKTQRGQRRKEDDHERFIAVTFHIFASLRETVFKFDAASNMPHT